MAVKVIMPKLGMGMEEGTVVEWLKQEGDEIQKGEAVAVISSDKIEKDIEAPADGVLLRIEAEADEMVKVGEAIGLIGAAGENTDPVHAPQADLEQEAPDMPQQQPASVQRTEEKEAVMASGALRNGGRTRISPAARKLAKTHHVDITGIPGTGPNGRIVKADVQRHIDHNKPDAPEAPAHIPQREEAREHAPAAGKPMTGMRKVIAERMLGSLQTTAQLTLTMKADITDLMMIRKQMNESLAASSVKITLTDFIAKAVIAALKQHPQINATLEEGRITEHDRVHLGIAVALDAGLMVPVIKDAGDLPLTQLSRRIEEQAAKARSGDISPDELKGSTFTISNLGKYDVEFFTPVLNPPEAGILGVGRARPEAVFIGDDLQKRTIQPLSLTFDHRVLDGAPAAAFLQTVKEMLQQPYRMLAE